LDKTFKQMRQNPAADWAMRDVQRVCREHGLICTAPTGGGSHFKVSHPKSRDILTIPARRPIKTVYIRKLIRMIEEVA
jgi:predicted RNA binding protein YcfA (HicA-like mRNA interferase family)